MKTLFLEAPFDGLVKLTKETLTYLKKKGYKTIAVYASVQFVNNLKKVKDQLKDYKIITSKPARVDIDSQLLGCNIYGLNLEDDVDCYLYIGDGKFHPLALVYSQKDTQKEVICNDPINKTTTILTKNTIMISLKRYKASLIKYLSANNVGVIITTKPGQEQYLSGLRLKEMYPDKKFYYFVDNNISFDYLENFPFIDVWVNTACPRIALDDQERFKAVINLADALNMDEALRNKI